MTAPPTPAAPPTSANVSDRTRLRRMPERGHHDRSAIDGILDEGLVCHVGFVEGGRPVVIPTGYVRDGDRLLLHGSRASRLLKAMAAGADLCITVTLLDGLVLARSGFNHSMNYRSVVLFGKATPVPDGQAESALRTYMEHLLPGRWDRLRPTTAKEVAATQVVAFPIDQASAKVRAGPTKDEPADLAWPVWAGVIPLRLAPGLPEQDPQSAVHAVPRSLALWRPDGRAGNAADSR